MKQAFNVDCQRCSPVISRKNWINGRSSGKVSASTISRTGCWAAAAVPFASPEANGRLVRPLAPRGLDALSGLAVAARPGPAPVVPRDPPRATTDDAAARLRATRAAEAAAREREARRQHAEAALAQARAGLARAEAAVDQAERDLVTRQAERLAARDALTRAQREFEGLSFGR